MRSKRRYRIDRQRRRGAIAVLTAVVMVILLAMVAFAVDIGYLLIAKSDLQRAADAAAHAAVLEYRSDAINGHVFRNVRNIASEYVQDNQVLNSTATVSLNSQNADLDGDLVLGKIDFEYPRQPMTFGDLAEFNAVTVRIRRSTARNGEVPLFFARIFGQESLQLEAEATAAIIRNVGGFKVPPSGENVPFLPITIHEDLWSSEVAKSTDEWAWDAAEQSITEGPDDISEVVLFPNDPDASGNFGLVNVAISANSAGYIGRQIRNGLSQSDLDYYGGELALDDYGKLLLSGNTGLKTSIKDDLQAMAGEPRVIPLFREVNGDGNNSTFVIVKFVGVRVMAVDLGDGEKFVSVQPADVTFKGITQAAMPGTSEKVYSPPVIVQ